MNHVIILHVIMLFVHNHAILYTIKHQTALARTTPYDSDHQSVTRLLYYKLKSDNKIKIKLK